ncbi:FAD/NAD(P)-binding protein [Thermodesulfobacteriota bacterium]
MIQLSEQNIYLPIPAVIKEIIEENSQIKSFELAFTDEDYHLDFAYSPGQFMMVSVPHCGEAPISFSSTPSRPGTITLSIREAGKLTSAIHQMKKGDCIGLRGPYGKPFDLEFPLGKDLLFVAGGIGLAPLRSVINYSLDNQADYGRKTILYGSREPNDIAFREDIDTWQDRDDTTCLLTVDVGNAEWDGNVGLVTTLLDRVETSPDTTIAYVCGPPMMIKAVLKELSSRGFADEHIITTLERHMKCGVGICRHCHMDSSLVCVDGPVFNLAELKNLEVSELAP